MNAEHYNELITLSQKIYDDATEKLTNYCSQKYCAVGNDTMEPQLEDYLFMAEETSAYLLLDENSQEKEIQTFTENLSRVIRYAQQKAINDNKPC